MLKRAAEARREVDPALVKRIAESVGSSLAPVRPLPPAWVMTGGLVLICLSIATGGAALLGLHGILKLGFLEPAVLFPAMGILIWLAAATSVNEMIPGS